MQNFIKRIPRELIIIGVCLPLGFCLTYFTFPKKGDIVQINCEISEISPDFTPEMREACRQLRAKNFQEDLKKPK